MNFAPACLRQTYAVLCARPMSAVNVYMLRTQRAYPAPIYRALRSGCDISPPANEINAGYWAEEIE